MGIEAAVTYEDTIITGYRDHCQQVSYLKNLVFICNEVYERRYSIPNHF